MNPNGWTPDLVPSEGRCHAHVDIDLIRDDDEGPIPHAFPCDLPAGHEPRPHSATVTWLDGEE